IAPTSTGGAFIASVYGDFHTLATRASVVDHERCFRVRGRSFVPQTVSVNDRFGAASVSVYKPYRFCTPTSVSGDPVADASTHHLCYRIRGSIPDTFISFLSNRIDGYRAYEVGKFDTLCVPAEIVGQPSAHAHDAYRCLNGPRYQSGPIDIVLSDAFGS